MNTATNLTNNANNSNNADVLVQDDVSGIAEIAIHELAYVGGGGVVDTLG